MKIPSRIFLIASLAIFASAFAIACDSPAEKPTAEPEPPTAVPTVASQALDAGTTTGSRTLDGSARQAGGLGADLSNPEMQECLADELGDDVVAQLGRGSGIGLDPDSIAALEKCGVGATNDGGGFAGSRFADPELRECLDDELGEDILSEFGRGSGFSLDPESISALEKCGFELPSIDGGGFRFGGRGEFSGDDGIFGSGGLLGGDGSFQECMSEALGDDGLLALRNPTDGPSPEVQEALQQCGGVIGIPVEPNDEIGDGAEPIPVEPTLTPIPVSDLTIEQLTCLSGELSSSDLASAVVATSSGDLSQVPDEILAALQTCGVGI